MDASDLLQPFRVVPVVAIDDAATAVPLAETLFSAGIEVIEVTLRTPAALEAMERIAAAVPGMLVGAGSVRRADQFDEVRNRGAKFAVSPGCSDALLDAAAGCDMHYVPGAVTPSEMIVLLEHGYRLQKFFPAQAAGGLAMIKSVASPIPEARFMPTGGITPELAREYLALPNVAGIGGSWIAPAKLVARGDYARIGELAAGAAAIGV